MQENTICTPRTLMTPTAPTTHTTNAVVKYADNNPHTNLTLFTCHPPAVPSHSLSDSHLSTRQKDTSWMARAEFTTAPRTDNTSAPTLCLEDRHRSNACASIIEGVVEEKGVARGQQGHAWVRGGGWGEKGANLALKMESRAMGNIGAVRETDTDLVSGKFRDTRFNLSSAASCRTLPRPLRLIFIAFGRGVQKIVNCLKISSINHSRILRNENIQLS